MVDKRRKSRKMVLLTEFLSDGWYLTGLGRSERVEVGEGEETSCTVTPKGQGLRNRGSGGFSQ